MVPPVLVLRSVSSALLSPARRRRGRGMTTRHWLLLLVSLLLCAVLAAMVTAPVPELDEWTPQTVAPAVPASIEGATP